MKMTATRLRDWVRNKSQELNMSPSLIRRNYFLEQMLELIGNSKYKDDFIIKGGFLLSSKLGIQNRSTRKTK